MKKIISTLCMISVAATGFAATELVVTTATVGASMEVVSAPLTDVLFEQPANRKYTRDHQILRLPADRLTTMIESYLDKNPKEAADLFQALYEKDPSVAFNLMDKQFGSKVRHRLLMSLSDAFLGEFLQRMSINGKDIVGGEGQWCFSNKRDFSNPTDPEKHLKHIIHTGCRYDPKSYVYFVQRYIWFIMEFTPYEIKKGKIYGKYTEVEPISQESYNLRLVKVTGMLNHFLSTLGARDYLESVMSDDEKKSEVQKILKAAINKNPAIEAKVNEFVASKRDAYTDFPAELLAFEDIKKALAELKRAKAIEILAVSGGGIISRLPSDYLAHILYAFIHGGENNKFVLAVLDAIFQDGKYTSYLVEVLKYLPCSCLKDLMPYVDAKMLEKIFDKCFSENEDEFLLGLGAEVNNGKGAEEINELDADL